MLLCRGPHPFITGFFTLQNVGAGGLCLDSNAGGRIYNLPCNGGLYQKWELSPVAANVFGLEDEATRLYAGVKAGGTSSLWWLDMTSYDWQAGWFEVHNASDDTWSFELEGMCLDGNSHQYGPNFGGVYMTPCNGGLYQHFKLTPTAGFTQ